MAEVVREIDALRAVVRRARQQGQVIGFVPTMGALHEGHLSLIRTARRETGFVVVSIFVNPTQFGPGEDYERYPRMLDQDVPAAESAGADLIFAPTVEALYPPGSVTYVVQDRLTERLCGLSRPTHFHGVCTIVAKLFHLVQPDIAYFGQKDYQQSVIIRRMVVDLNFPVEIRVCPTVREPDGLAMSSRNRYLTPAERAQAVCLYRALKRAEALVHGGERRAHVIQAAMQDEIAQAPLARAEYVALVHPDTLEDVQEVTEGTVAALAVRFPSARLIDNLILRAPAATASGQGK